MSPHDPDDARASDPPPPLTVEEILAAACIGVLALITFANVVVRYLTSYSFAFTEEYSIILMVIMTLLGTAAAHRFDRHIRIGWFVEQLPPGGRRAAGVFATVCVVVMFAILAWLGARMAWDDWRFEVTTPALDHPQWIYTAWVPILSALVMVRALQRLVAIVRGPAP